jgi:4-hydroxybenzoate polyprenyltransferase
MGIIAILYAFTPHIKDITFVPNAVTGLTTFSGILIAAIGFWMLHVYSRLSESSKKWMVDELLRL